MKHITTEDALRALEEAVAEKGENYVYEFVTDDEGDWRSYTCVYAHGGAPSCIVGNALHRLGVPITELDRPQALLIEDLADETGWPIDDDALLVLSAAQDKQDSGRTWGTALADARQVLAIVAAREAVTHDA